MSEAESASSTWSPLPPLLLEILSNTLILENTLPYLPLPTILSLCFSSKNLRDLLLHTPSVFRYVDLSRCRGAYVSPDLLTRIDIGGHSWRAERMDENLTEDEFYAGPLRGVLSKFRQMKVLQNVQTLVLDGLASVTVDLLNDILTSPEYNVRLLSIRKCHNVNEHKLQQLLQYICRPSRPEGTPRLQGLYVFAPLEHLDINPRIYENLHVTRLDTTDYSDPNTANPWYTARGQVIAQGHAQRSSWEATLLACAGIINFDAVLCIHMHEDMDLVLISTSRDFLMDSASNYAVPPLATLALGPDGCADCGRSPQGAPVWGVSDLREFPLLWPPPATGTLLDAVRPPPRKGPDGKPSGSDLPQRLIVSCTWCLSNRYCEKCRRWWCSECYNTAKLRPGPSDLQRFSTAQGFGQIPTRHENETHPDSPIGVSPGNGNHTKVFGGLCIENCLGPAWADR
ncbi:hypothetical protein LTR41_000819 [Exophiala xenobiotica]|nr:hypothetical protein LTR41_000819 [Exophiala xenobiotica]KAK5320008.1 hypothetical protein LTR93_007065 [Exophiala xenobiotica]KAK5419607.1 hypothetical protein LTR06_001076 [Exophiala xenobiotica]